MGANHAPNTNPKIAKSQANCRILIESKYIKLPAEMRQLASHIIDTKTGHFDPKKFEDHYETALVELLKKKQAGLVVEPIREEEPAPHRVINLMDALRASLKSETKKPAAASTPIRGAAKKKATR